MHSRRCVTITCALAACLALALPLGCQAPARLEPISEPRTIEAEIATLNTAAYPEASYVVQAGDTPRSVATRLAVDFQILANANGLSEASVLTPGHLLVVPRVRVRSGSPYIALSGRGYTAPASPAASSPAPARSAPPAAPGAQESRPAPAAPASRPTPSGQVRIGADGVVRAAGGGVVSAVHRGYPSLGDVVIIDNDAEKVIYSGTFTPSVARGEVVTAGARIGAGAAGGAVRASVFPK